METLLQDLRYAVRMLGKAPAFTMVAVLALALGIGANTAIFSVIYAVLLEPLPYPEPERLVKIWTRFTGIGLPNDRNWVSPPEYQDLLQGREPFSEIAAYSDANFNITSGGTPERVEGAVVSAGFFRVLGIEAPVGRTFLSEEEQQGKENVVVLSHGLWQRRFGGDPTLPGNTISINGRQYLVAGVLPPGAEYPDTAEMWSVLVFTPDQLSPKFRGSHGLQVLARLKPGVTVDEARARMDTLAARMIDQHREYPYKEYNFGLIVTPLLEEIVGDIRPALLVLMGAVAFVLLIACANVANLLLARAASRQRELAIRSALGAGGRRLARQLLTESVILSLAGAIAGLVLAYWGVQVLVALGSQTFPRVAGTTLNIPVLLFTLVLSIATGILFGSSPALQATRSVTHESLKEGGRGSSTGIGALHLRKGLVVTEIAMALVLLAGAGLLIRSFLRLQEVSAGFRPQGVLTMRVALPQTRYSTQHMIIAFYRNVLERLRKLSAVEAAGAVSALPLSGINSSGTATIDTRAVPPQDASPEVDLRSVTPGYFEAMGISLIAGRYFDERDHEQAAKVAIVDETLAATYWPDESAIGRRLKRGGSQSTNPWLTVVGVVRHVRNRTLEAQSRAQLYWPHAQLAPLALTFAIRTSSDPKSLAPAAQRQVLAVDPEQPVYAVRTMDEWVARSVAQRRLLMMLLAIFAGVALLLAAVGIYGVLSYMVTQRSHEVGIRMALGARPVDVLRLIMRQSLSLTLAGLFAGLAGSLALTGLMSSLLFGVKSTDPLTFTAVALSLMLVALLASFVPARRATLVDPIHTLRQE